jgi:hypothetical protein
MVPKARKGKKKCGNKRIRNKKETKREGTR